jgi:hypothetical protein
MRAGNFLSTLMDRAFNRVEVIERRRPSLFESASGFESALGVAPVDAPHPQEPDLESNLHDHPASAPQPLDIRESGNSQDASRKRSGFPRRRFCE